MSELKPCPFCGEFLEYVKWFNVWVHPENNCVLSFDDSQDGLTIREETIEAWNRRAGEDENANV